ncbi:Cobyrinate a,c-diamide synthase [Geodia barretti]|uniref:Cobyrinate a,c-diamide synthase n=1 Tax=Geodia barretti TaxID=519541 RepID=A0AA35RPL0_GEOBA|nr:Cobyrinate a,c-diamide synthase [Geodia barretti]
MGALARRGRKVQPFKAGPDYIDPTYHGIACGVPSRNLDTWLLPHPVVTELFHRASGAADIAVVEGVMGVFDGHSSLDEDGSTAELAKLLDAPVILIADAGKVARSVAAEILGYQKFDPDLRIAGVILNGVGSERHLEFCQPQIEATTGLPVVGWLPRRDDLVQPERHLGLIPTVEGTVVNEWYDALNAQVELTIDIDAIARIAATAGQCSQRSSSRPARRLRWRRIGPFSFYYQDSLDLLAAWGAEVIPFSPLDDRALPANVGGVYLGGGFPELFAEELSGMFPCCNRYETPPPEACRFTPSAAG